MQNTSADTGQISYENRQPPEIPSTPDEDDHEEYTAVDVSSPTVEHASEEFYAELGDAEEPANYVVTE